MSDGPHKSLDMRRGWKRVAECGDNVAFAPEEVSKTIVPALNEDCNAEIAPGFLESVAAVFVDRESSLFKEPIAPRLEALRRAAGCGMGRAVLENAIEVAERGGMGMEALVDAASNALADRAARGARQVEEHYCRKANSVRAQKVRARIEEGIAQAGIKDLARHILRVQPRNSPSPRTLKHKGLDDGVKL